MESPRSSEPLAFWSLSGDPLPAPREWESALVEVNTPVPLWESAQLWCNGTPLPLGVQRVGGRARVVAAWPLSGPGNYALRFAESQRAAPTETVVSVLPRKIGRAGFEALLADLEARLPVSIALGFQRCGARLGVATVEPHAGTYVEAFQRLHTAVRGGDTVPGLIVLLPRIARAPHATLRSDGHWVRRESARRPDPTRLMHALARPGNLAPERQPRHIVDTQVTASVDTPENRLVLAYCDNVRARLRRLARIAPDPAMRQACEALSDQLEDARRRAPFLREVAQPAFLPQQPSLTLLHRPEYRAILQGYLSLHRSIGVRLDDDALEAPLENLPSLYQTWGTLEIVDALLRAGAAAGFSVESQQLLHRDADGEFVRVLRDGLPALRLRHPESGVLVTLTPERRFGVRRTGGFYSASFEQRPDVVIEVQPPDAPPRLYLFDPKYRLDAEDDATGRPKKADIDKMHAYRDAIRDTTGDDATRPVRLAAILYPGPRTRFGPGIAALEALPGSDSLPEQLQPILRAALA